jgi:hypothetical protein
MLEPTVTVRMEEGALRRSFAAMLFLRALKRFCSTDRSVS